MNLILILDFYSSKPSHHTDFKIAICKCVISIDYVHLAVSHESQKNLTLDQAIGKMHWQRLNISFSILTFFYGNLDHTNLIFSLTGQPTLIFKKSKYSQTCL